MAKRIRRVHIHAVSVFVDTCFSYLLCRSSKRRFTLFQAWQNGAGGWPERRCGRENRRPQLPFSIGTSAEYTAGGARPGKVHHQHHLTHFRLSAHRRCCCLWRWTAKARGRPLLRAFRVAEWAPLQGRGRSPQHLSGVFFLGQKSASARVPVRLSPPRRLPDRAARDHTETDKVDSRCRHVVTSTLRYPTRINRTP